MHAKAEVKLENLLIYSLCLYRDAGETPNLEERQTVAEAVKKAEEASDCIVELPLTSRCVKLGCKETGVRYYASDNDLANIAYISRSEEGYDEEWSASGAFQAAPPRTRPHWERFFQSLKNELEAHPTKIGKDILDLCYY